MDSELSSPGPRTYQGNMWTPCDIMFLHMYVILFTGGISQHALGQSGVTRGWCVWLGGVIMGVWPGEGECVTKGVTRGCVWPREVTRGCVWPGGVSDQGGVTRRVYTPRTHTPNGRQEGSTHPTGIVVKFLHMQDHFWCKHIQQIVFS